MKTRFCFECTSMPHDRCKHLLGRRAATPVTPADGCAYFFDRAAPLVAPLVCPRCACEKWFVILNLAYCQNCGHSRPA